MATRQLTERTIYEARCECGTRDIRESNPPREVQCPKCGKWNRYELNTYIGPDKFGKAEGS